MILEEAHIAGQESLPQMCALCGSVIALSDSPKPFPAGSRVGVVIGTAAQTFSSYIAGQCDSNPGCDKRTA